MTSPVSTGVYLSAMAAALVLHLLLLARETCAFATAAAGRGAFSTTTTSANGSTNTILKSSYLDSLSPAGPSERIGSPSATHATDIATPLSSSDVGDVLAEVERQRLEQLGFEYQNMDAYTHHVIHEGAAPSSAPPDAQFDYVPILGLSHADVIANNVIEICHRNGFNPITVHVLDASGHTLVAKRMDGCSPVGIPEISRAKAYGCIVNKYPSRAFRDRYTSEPETSAQFCQMTTMVAISGNRMAPFPGGILMKVGDHIVGAVGVSGAAGGECWPVLKNLYQLFHSK